MTQFHCSDEWSQSLKVNWIGFAQNNNNIHKKAKKMKLCLREIPRGNFRFWQPQK